MFDKNKPIPGPGTVVGANVKLTGTLKDINDITVHGSVDGEVISDKNVLIAETASVKGPVSAQNVTIAGKVDGAINAWQKLEILSTGKVHGSIMSKDLNIRSGAAFNGKSKMLTETNEETSKEKAAKDIKPEAKSLDEKAEKTKYELD
ncbi:MAG: polymer-forming cytoskeletal protein [Patescibacteria group bacterium]|nr:polymer-forming cytoskeletal protein [Patescibacteria group bacterium]